MTRAVIYARFSDPKQSEGMTIQTQIDTCRRFIESQGWIHTSTYMDEGKSGRTTGGREDYLRMIEDVSTGAFEMIVVFKYSRFGRNFMESVRSIYEVEQYHSVRVCSATEGDNPLVRNIMLAVADDYSRELSDTVSRNMIQVAKKGKHTGGAAPYGYRTVKREDGFTYEIQEENGPVVRRWFNRLGLPARRHPRRPRSICRAGIPDRDRVAGCSPQQTLPRGARCGSRIGPGSAPPRERDAVRPKIQGSRHQRPRRGRVSSNGKNCRVPRHGPRHAVARRGETHVG